MSPETRWASTHFMLYWKITPDQRLDLANRRRADYASHNQLNRVKPGDVLWIVNVYHQQLFLLGRIAVEMVIDDLTIAQEIVDSHTDDWYEADWYAIANKYNVEPLREVNISQFADQIRFNSESEQLDLTDGVDVKQLLPLRELHPSTADLLQDFWYDDQFTPDSVHDYLELLEDDMSYSEGRTIVRTVRQRQRNKKLIADAKQQFKNEHGDLFCEACGFNFNEAYGVEYIEAHHIEQVASFEGEQSTKISDLVMLCANCHRIAHTRTPPYTVSELQEMLNKEESND